MNVSTVFPEGYVENNRAQRHASSVRKGDVEMPEENEDRDAHERIQRESCNILLYLMLHKKWKKGFCLFEWEPTQNIF